MSGNLTRDPEVRYLNSGTAVCEIGLAINERVKRQGEWTEETHFFEWVLWGRTAEVAGEYLKKGRTVLLEGRARLEQWEQDGQRRQRVKFTCDRMEMVGGRDSAPTEQQKAPVSRKPETEPVGYTDDIPF
jgi:single-strand DNA-binding protein